MGPTAMEMTVRLGAAPHQARTWSSTKEGLGVSGMSRFLVIAACSGQQMVLVAQIVLAYVQYTRFTSSGSVWLGAMPVAVTRANGQYNTLG